MSNLPITIVQLDSLRWNVLTPLKNARLSRKEDFLDKIASHSYPFLSLSDIGFTTSSIKVTPYDISTHLIDNYEATRNFPGWYLLNLTNPETA